MENKKYRITVLSEKELMAKADGFPDCAGRIEIDGIKFDSEMMRYAGKTIIAEKVDFKYLFKGKYYYQDMISKVEPIEEAGVWVESDKRMDNYFANIASVDQKGESSFSQKDTEKPLFPIDKQTFISMEDLSEFLKWKENRDKYLEKCVEEKIKEITHIFSKGPIMNSNGNYEFPGLPKFSNIEKNAVYIWLAKDDDESVNIFERCPKLEDGRWINEDEKGDFPYSETDRHSFLKNLATSDRPIKIKIK